jgi:hypothetical protein
MRRWFFRGWRSAGRLSIVLLVATAGCNRGITFFHDAAFVSNGAYMEAASLMPGCGCVTLKNATDGPNRRDIYLVAEMFGTRRGALRLNAGQQARIRFDWAGADDADRYEIFSHEIGSEGNPGERMSHAWDGFSKVGSIVETTCEDSLCQFGSLSMDRAHSAVELQHEVRHEPGVHLVDGGQQIELASVQPTCGCVVLENITKETIRLKAGYHGTDEGVMPLPGGSGDDRFTFIGFDWAGALEEDVYTLSAVSMTATPDEIMNRDVQKSTSNTKGLKISDHVRVIEEMNFLPCSPEGAIMLRPLPKVTSADEPPAAPPAPPICPFVPFKMNRALGNATGPVLTPAAPGGGRGGRGVTGKKP